MDVFLVREYSSHEIGEVTSFLKRKGVSRAETHAVALHLGYRYNIEGVEHMAIDGYCDRKPMSVHLASPKKKGPKKKRRKPQKDWYESRGFSRSLS